MASAVIQARECWDWRKHPEHRHLYELYDRDRLLAWITKRPDYCDRGHWQMNVECVPDLDAADCFPRYFMWYEHARVEAEEFLAWRLFKQKASLR